MPYGLLTRAQAGASRADLRQRSRRLNAKQMIPPRTADSRLPISRSRAQPPFSSPESSTAWPIRFMRMDRSRPSCRTERSSSARSPNCARISKATRKPRSRTHARTTLAHACEPFLIRLRRASARLSRPGRAERRPAISIAQDKVRPLQAGWGVRQNTASIRQGLSFSILQSFLPFRNSNNRTALNAQKYGFRCATSKISAAGNPG